MEDLPKEVLYIVCDFTAAADVMHVRLTCKRNVVSRKYACERNRTRTCCFTSPTTTITTRWSEGGKYKSRISLGTLQSPTVLTCYSRRGHSCKRVCAKMVDMIVPHVSGEFRYVDHQPV